jgi:SEA/GATOR complex protein SEA4/MIOS
LEDWSEILQEESLPLRERLAIAFRFLDDRALSSYLRQLTDRFRVHGDIEGIIVTGLTPIGLDVLQGYVDSTGDVQSASILAAFVCPGTFKDARAERWLEAYRSLLDSWKLFHHRCQLDISRGKIIKEAVTKEDVPPFDWVAPQLAIKCGFCNKAINARTPMAGPGGRTRVWWIH